MRNHLRILQFARPEWPLLSLIVVLSLSFGILAALQPWPLKILIDYALGDAALSTSAVSWFNTFGLEITPVRLIVLAALSSIFIALLSSLLDAVLTMAWATAGQRMVYAVASALFLQLQRLSLIFHARHSVGDWLTRITSDSWSVYTVVNGILVSPLREFMVIASVGTLAWFLDPNLTLLMLIAVPLLVASGRYFGTKLKRYARQMRQIRSEVTAFVHQVLGAMPLVQAFGTGSRNLEVYDVLSQQAVVARKRNALFNNGFVTVNSVATTLGIALVVYFGGWRVLLGQLSIGSLLVFMAYMRTLGGAWHGLLQTYGSLRSSEASIERVVEILVEKDAVRNAPDAKDLPNREKGSSGHIVFESVEFSYGPGAPVLKEFSFEVRPGEVIALVGPTGVGKSTVASLLLRFFDPWKGRILLDGMDLRDVQLENLRSEVVLILQDPFILPISIADNIAYGRPNADRDEIIAAAKAAKADEFICKLPDGYDTVVGEQGSTLSGGQRQRLAIARALLKNPRVLVLDEPTAALDLSTERSVMDALARLMEGRTTLIIAHRLATIARADRIAVMNKGRIIEAGTHADLIASGGAYAQMHAVRSSNNREESSA